MEEGWDAARVGGAERVHSSEREASVLLKHCPKPCWGVAGQRRWRCLVLQGCGFLHTVGCRMREEGGKAGSKCPCGLWVLVAQLRVVLCLLEDWWVPSIARKAGARAVLWLPACWGSWVPWEGCYGGAGGCSLPSSWRGLPREGQEVSH